MILSYCDNDKEEETKDDIKETTKGTFD